MKEGFLADCTISPLVTDQSAKNASFIGCYFTVYQQEWSTAIATFIATMSTHSAVGRSDGRSVGAALRSKYCKFGCGAGGGRFLEKRN